MVKVGCSGFPVARGTYFRQLGAVEIRSAFVRPPKPETAAAWRAEAPEDFEFALHAWQLITHLPSSPSYGKLRAADCPRMHLCGHFKGTEEVARAWARVEAVAEVLRPSFIVFRTPSTFYPNADHLRDMYRFFKGIRRGPRTLAWQPTGSWEETLIRKVCEDLNLTHATLPESVCQRGAAAYYRVPAPRGINPKPFDAAALAARLAGKNAYVFFDTPDSWNEARRFLDLVRPGQRPASARRLCAD